MVEKGGADLYLKAGSPPTARVGDEFVVLNSKDIDWEGEKLTPAETSEMAFALMTETQLLNFNSTQQADFAYSIPDLSRFRINIFRQRGSVGLVIRVVAGKAPDLDALGLPEFLKDLCNKRRGMVLVAGLAGSGKSTTVAAMVDHINNTRKAHIITLEEPVEFLHKDNLSLITQREIGVDTPTFADGLRASLRQHPDVIVIGEMRDLETISAALAAAEAGNLVLGTLHTLGAVQSISRIVDAFPSYQKDQVKTQLSFTLEAIFSQTLLPHKDDTEKKVLAYEFLKVTPGVKNLIREEKTHQVYTLMQTGRKEGMCTMNMSLIDLYRKGLISKETAFTYTTDHSELRQAIGGPTLWQERMAV